MEPNASKGPPSVKIRLWRVALAAAFLNALTSLLLAAVTQAEHAIGLSLKVNTTKEIWLAEALLVAATCSLPLSPYLGSKLGARGALIGCSLTLVLGSLTASQANSLPVLLALLFVCGSVAAPLAALSQTLIVQTMPKDRQGWGLAFWNGGNVLGLLMGTWGAAHFAQQQAWRPIFCLPLPLAVLGCLLLPGGQQSSSATASLDKKGYLLQLGGTLSLSLGLTLMPILGWRDPRSSLLLLGPFLLALYARHAATVARPLLSLGPLKSPTSRRAILLAFAFGTVSTGTMESNFLVGELQLSPELYAVRALGQSLVSFFAVAWASRWIQTAPFRGLMLAFSFTCVGKFGFNLFHPGINYAALWPFIVSGLGYWMIVTILASLAVRDQGTRVTDSAALFALALQFGSTLGLALLDALFDSLTPRLGKLDAFSVVFWIQWAITGILLIALPKIFSKLQDD